MKYIDEYRDPTAIKKYVEILKKITTKTWSIMEICGGQTHSIMKYGIDCLIPSCITLIHGPGCPVCVTPANYIDKAIELSKQSNIIICSFGDMLRVPGSKDSLLSAKANGGDIRTVYSPLDAIKVAQEHPDKEVVFLGVGFETTAPATALAIELAHRNQLNNFSMLISHVLVPPAMRAILADPECRIDAFLAAGHVCAVTGYEEYIPIANDYKIPVVVTGFEPADIMQGITMAIAQLEKGISEVENQYTRAVNKEGNTNALSLISKVFEVCDREWRGIGVIPQSGYDLRSEYKPFDAEKKFNIKIPQNQNENICISGLILRGLKKPNECPAFGKECTPTLPLGATMVSSEGACAAYYRYKRRTVKP